MPGDEGAEDTPLLAIYLRDHRAAAAGGLSLLKRSAKSNHGNDFGRVLQGLRVDAEADLRAMDEALRAVGVRKSALKTTLAVAGERIGRLKLNGRVRQYSPLSRVLELEGLEVGVRAKQLMWATLAQAQSAEPRLASIDLGSLQRRADDELQRLRRLHDDAVGIALGNRSEQEQAVLPGGVEPSPTRPPGDSPWVGSSGGDDPAPAGGPGVTPPATGSGNADTSVFDDPSPRPRVATEDELQSADEDTFPPSV